MDAGMFHRHEPGDVIHHERPRVDYLRPEGIGNSQLCALHKTKRAARAGLQYNSLCHQNSIAPVVGKRTAYTLVEAVMNKRLRFGPPKQTFETSSGTKTLPSSVPSGW